MLQIELLGDLRITVDGHRLPTPTSQKARLVLARLSELGGNLARDVLAETFWDTTQASARVSLSTELKNLRRALGSSSGLLTSTRNYVGLPECDELRIDVREFAEHLRRERYREAVALWRGDFLQDTGGAWAEQARERYRRAAARALGRLAEQAESSGDRVAAVEFARRQLDLLPDELDAWRRLISLLSAMGDSLAAETERNNLLERYARRGHPVPPAVLDLIGAKPAPVTTPTAGPERSLPAPTPGGPRAPQGVEDPERLEALIDSEPRSPLYTGLVELDQLLGGLPEPGLTIIAGRPGMGVTTLALTIAANATMDLRIPTALFSVESSEAELAQRFVAMRARVSCAELRRGRVRESRWPKILSASQALASAPLWIDDTPQLSVEAILSKVRRLKNESATRVVLIDSIHGLSADRGPALNSRSIASLLFELRAAARQLDVAMVVTMEVFGDCDKRAAKQPQLPDLPGYFELAARRDLVLLLYRDEYYHADSDRPGELDVIVAENHHGPTGRVSLGFDARTPRVLNLLTEPNGSAPDIDQSPVGASS